LPDGDAPCVPVVGSPATTAIGAGQPTARGMMTGLSANWLQNSCQGRRSVINKIENFIKAGHDKNAFGYGGDIAKNKPMSRVLQQIVQY